MAEAIFEVGVKARAVGRVARAAAREMARAVAGPVAAERTAGCAGGNGRLCNGRMQQRNSIYILT